MSFFCSFIMLIGRICISAMFIIAGIHKFMDYDATAAYMASKQVPAIPFFLYAAACIEVVGGVFVLIGFKTRYAAAVLALFLIPVSLIFHDFWNLTDQADKQLEMIHFFSNFAIFGGLLYVACCGAGSCAVDRSEKE